MSTTQAVIGASEEKTCSRHGSFVSVGTGGNKFRMVLWSSCPACEAEREVMRREQDAADAKREFAERLRAINLPPRFSAKTLDDYEVTTAGQRKALSIAKEYASNFDEHFKAGRCLIFSGKVGCGKTHLAAAICREIISKPFVDGADWRSAKSHLCRYTTASAMIRDVRETWGKKELSEVDALRKFTRPHLLVIDEVGRQYGSDAEKTQMEELLDMRYQEMRPTLVCTNCDKTQLAQFLGERGLDRLFENKGIVAIFDWASHRGEK